MRAWVVIDAQNEFSQGGQRSVRGHGAIIERIKDQVAEARKSGQPIAWVRHHNRPDEAAAFVPGSWGAELSEGLGPAPGSAREKLFEKSVFGAFHASGLESWLRGAGVEELVLMGFFTHMCGSTTAREALMRDFSVYVDAEATGAQDLVHPSLGTQTAEQVRRTALLQLTDMGVRLLDEAQAGPALAHAVVSGRR